jgi:hypothetical protein
VLADEPVEYVEVSDSKTPYDNEELVDASDEKLEFKMSCVSSFLCANSASFTSSCFGLGLLDFNLKSMSKTRGNLPGTIRSVFGILSVVFIERLVSVTGSRPELRIIACKRKNKKTNTNAYFEKKALFPQHTVISSSFDHFFVT